MRACNEADAQENRSKQIFNHLCRYFYGAHRFPQIFFTPFPTTTYELQPPKITPNFRYKRAGLSNYREDPFRGSLAPFMGRFEKLILESRDTRHGSTNNEQRTMNDFAKNSISQIKTRICQKSKAKIRGISGGNRGKTGENGGNRGKPGEIGGFW